VIDLDLERLWAELLLAVKDMQLTIALIERIPQERSDHELFFDSIGVVACYCRPFKPNRQKRIVGADFLAILSAEERALHDRIIDIRDRDHAHSDLYEGRVAAKIDAANIWIREGVDPEKASAEDITITFAHWLKATTRSPTRDELSALRDLAAKLADAFQNASRVYGGKVLALRGSAGYSDWFVPGFTTKGSSEA
jgi:hypothetical protein